MYRGYFNIAPRGRRNTCGAGGHFLLAYSTLSQAVVATSGWCEPPYRPGPHEPTWGYSSEDRTNLIMYPFNHAAVLQPGDGGTRVAVSGAGERDVTSDQTLHQRRRRFGESGWTCTIKHMTWNPTSFPITSLYHQISSHAVIELLDVDVHPVWRCTT